MSRPQRIVSYVAYGNGHRYTCIVGSTKDAEELAQCTLTGDPLAVMVGNELDKLTGQQRITIDHGKDRRGE